MIRSRIAPITSLLAMLTACAAGPDYQPPQSATLGVPHAYSGPATNGGQQDISAWWTAFNDAELTSIIDRARRDNLDIAQAVARLKQAREGLVQARGQLLPSASASAGYGRDLLDATGPRDSFSIGADASYQVDLFGGVRRSIEAARATADASGYDLAAVQTSIAAEVARNYVLVRLYQTARKIARDSLAIQDDNLEIAGFRVQAGLVSSLDQEQARAQRAQTAAQLPTIEQNYVAAVNRLGVLTGQAPGALRAELEAPQPIPTGPAQIPVGIPGDILRQRPDVRAAERNLAAATAQIGVQQAALYPALNITANIGTAASAIGNLGNIVTGGLFAGLSQLLFDGGRTRSRVRAQEAAAEGAFASYKSTVLGSLEDVENALQALQAAKQRRLEFTTAFQATNAAAILARSQYRSGLTDFTTLNNSEASLLSAQNGLNNAAGDEAQALIALYLALGGGWDSARVPTIRQD